ncbi:MAG: hypothetical protein US49_C0004G0042 [candidate division TM6 bacterium GW2011_GWF2_37_49]|nr:MAG: hypothetical protein US49_C0004G0042 [candidate division TM6 bacterium GW2011_GWF2_37_49]
MPLLSGCTKGIDNLFSSDGVEIYLLKAYKTVENSQKIDQKSVVLKNSPVVKYSDILSYNSDNHTFKVSDRALDAIKNIDHSVFGVAFAVTANGRVVYTGYFWPSYSSASCNWVTIEPFMAEYTKELKVTLGYPGDWEGVEDRRNDERIISILSRDKKLIK